MKNALVKGLCNTRLLLAVTLLFSLTRLEAQEERRQLLEKTLDAPAKVSVHHQHGPLLILPSADGRLRYEAEIRFRADDASAAQQMFDHFSVKSEESGGELRLQTMNEIKNWKSHNNKVTITFQNGEEVRNVYDLKINMRVYVPKLERLHLVNKYDDITVENDFRGDLAVTLYSGEVETEDIDGNLELDMKYSKGEFGSFRDGTLQLYDSDVELENGQSVTVNSKYSKLELGDVAQLRLESYDDEIETGPVQGLLTITDKYSDIAIERFAQAQMDLYETKLEAETGEDLQAKSRYANVEIEQLGSLTFELSYDDKIEIGRLGSLSSESKYSDYAIGTLERRLKIDSYDDELKIERITGPLEEISFNGKYTDLHLPLPGDAAYLLEANLTYGDLKFPEDRLEQQFYKEKNDRLEMRARIKGAGEESPKILITSYDGDVNIQ